LALDRFKATGAELIRGEAHFIAPKTVEVHLNDGGRRTVIGDRVFLDLGSRAMMPDIASLAGAKPMTHIEADRMLESGYFRARIAQENLIGAASIPYSIVRATQFFEFVKAIADYSTEGNKVRLPHVFFQPIGEHRANAG
jgi:uncharacterized protein YbjT (DUF2867 family)